MSIAPQSVDPSRYTEGRDRYVNFAEDVLALELSREQKQVLRAVAEHDRVVIMSGNGVGKSFVVAVVKLAFVATNIDSTVLGTSGSYSQYVDAVWRPMKTLHREAKARVGLPGETYDGGQPTLEIDDDWFAKVVSPRDPGDLEGRHADAVLVVIEEADKRYIEDEHFDSAGSSITDDNDRMIAICNPPRDETNAVHDRLESNRWHTIQFSTLDSHNVRVDAGELDAEKISGLTDLDTVIDDWEEWNGEAWPGLEQARAWSDPDSPEFREDLDERWYRRRAGVMPPAGAEQNRPFDIDTVDAAYDSRSDWAGPWNGVGIDVARSGDRTVMIAERGGALTVEYSEPGTDHTVQFNRIWDLLDEAPDVAIAIDAVGEGSGKADDTAARYPEVERFSNGATAIQETEFKNRWTEGLCELGNYMEAGGTITDSRLRKELAVAARVIALDEQYLASRDGEVLVADPKDKVKDRLGYSPDHLDAAIMAILAADDMIDTGPPEADLWVINE